MRWEEKKTTEKNHGCIEGGRNESWCDRIGLMTLQRGLTSKRDLNLCIGALLCLYFPNQSLCGGNGFLQFNQSR